MATAARTWAINTSNPPSQITRHMERPERVNPANLPHLRIEIKFLRRATVDPILDQRDENFLHQFIRCLDR